MIQDLDFGKLDNQYRPEIPADEDFVVCAQKGGILVYRNDEDELTLPTWGHVKEWSAVADSGQLNAEGDMQSAAGWKKWFDEPLQYAFTLQDKKYFIFMGEAGEAADVRFAYEAARGLMKSATRNIGFALVTAWHIYSWYRANRFCGVCGHPTNHDGRERMMRCPECGNMIFPRIAPAAIIALTHGDKIMLAQHAAIKQKRYGLLAGFIEIGETAEEAVAREVMEEVGLKVKNIRYYKTQPWGVVGNLSIGYFCDLDGDDSVTLDETELRSAEWHHRDHIPPEAADDGVSLTREMIRIFSEGKEPK